MFKGHVWSNKSKVFNLVALFKYTYGNPYGRMMGKSIISWHDLRTGTD